MGEGCQRYSLLMLLHAQQVIQKIARGEAAMSLLLGVHWAQTTPKHSEVYREAATSTTVSISVTSTSWRQTQAARCCVNHVQPT